MPTVITNEGERWLTGILMRRYCMLVEEIREEVLREFTPKIKCGDCHWCFATTDHPYDPNLMNVGMCMAGVAFKDGNGPAYVPLDMYRQCSNFNRPKSESILGENNG